MGKVYRMRRITTAQAAAVMGCDPLFVREMMRREQLPIGIAEKKEDSKRDITQMSEKSAAICGEIVCIKLSCKTMVSRFHQQINQKSHKGVKIVDVIQLYHSADRQHHRKIC